MCFVLYFLGYCMWYLKFFYFVICYLFVIFSLCNDFVWGGLVFVFFMGSFYFKCCYIILCCYFLFIVLFYYGVFNVCIVFSM